MLRLKLSINIKELTFLEPLEIRMLRNQSHEALLAAVGFGLLDDTVAPMSAVAHRLPGDEPVDVDAAEEDVFVVWGLVVLVVVLVVGGSWSQRCS